MKKGKRQRSSYNFEDGLFSFEFSEWTQRRIAPYALLTHVTTILLFVCYIYSASKSDSQSGSIDFSRGAYTAVELPEEKKGLFHFNLFQNFPSGAPIYSELEIEVLDEHFGHLFSVYKDLWQERHPNGEGGTSIYSDNRMEFQLVLPKAKKIYLRAFSNNRADIIFSMYRKNSGTLYFVMALWISGVLSAIFLIGMTKWGTPAIMVSRVKKSKSLRNNKGVKRTAIGVAGVLVLLFVFSMVYTGYPKAGDRSQTPSIFFKKNEVIYLG